MLIFKIQDFKVHGKICSQIRRFARKKMEEAALKQCAKPACIVMLKNENKQGAIQRTLKNCVTFASRVFILDTGSSDGTIQACRDYLKKFELKVFVKKHEFDDFASRFDSSCGFCFGRKLNLLTSVCFSFSAGTVF